MRDDFAAAVVDTLAKRVGMRCSNPRCRLPTSGPRDEPTKAINVGVAAHIAAASPGGPRYDPAMTSEQRRSIENGIWLCQTCSKLIDSDIGRYTVAVLHEWKRTAEEFALNAIESPRAEATASELIRQAKAFEAGRLLMGTFLELQIDCDYDYIPFVERAAAYLADLDVQGIDFACMAPGIDFVKLRTLCERIIQQLWARTRVVSYFEASLNLFTTLPSNDLDSFRKIVDTLKIPADLKQDRENAMIWLADLREYFEGALFPSA